MDRTCPARVHLNPTRHRVPPVRMRHGHLVLECLAVLALMATVLAVSYPGMVRWSERRALDRAASEAVAILQDARRAMMLLRHSVRLEHAVEAGHGSCLLLHSGRVGDCFGCIRPQCRPGAHLISRGAVWPATVESQLQPASLWWHGGSGTVVPTGTLVLRQGTLELQLIVNVLGRWRLCSPAAWRPEVGPC